MPAPLDPGPILQTAFAFWSSKVLLTAVELGVFSRLSAANAAYKLLDELGEADVIGPVLLGMAKPVHVLQRGCSVQDVLNLATVAAVDWQTRND